MGGILQELRAGREDEPTPGPGGHRAGRGKGSSRRTVEQSRDKRPPLPSRPTQPGLLWRSLLRERQLPPTVRSRHVGTESRTGMSDLLWRGAMRCCWRLWTTGKPVAFCIIEHVFFAPPGPKNREFSALFSAIAEREGGSLMVYIKVRADFVCPPGVGWRAVCTARSKVQGARPKAQGPRSKVQKAKRRGCRSKLSLCGISSLGSEVCRRGRKAAS